VMDLPVSTSESEGAGEGGVIHDESWGGIDGIDDPRALVIDGEASKCNFEGCGGCVCGSDQLGDGATRVAAGSGALRASDHGKFSPLVHSCQHDLLGVQFHYGIGGDCLVETVGAPPTGVGVTSYIIEFSIITPVIGCSSSICPSSKLNGGAGSSDHCITGSNCSSSSIISEWSCWSIQGTDEGAEGCSRLAAGALVQSGTTNLFRISS